MGAHSGHIPLDVKGGSRGSWEDVSGGLPGLVSDPPRGTTKTCRALRTCEHALTLVNSAGKQGQVLGRRSPPQRGPEVRSKPSAFSREERTAGRVGNRAS